MPIAVFGLDVVIELMVIAKLEHPSRNAIEGVMPIDVLNHLVVRVKVSVNGGHGFGEQGHLLP